MAIQGTMITIGGGGNGGQSNPAMYKGTSTPSSTTGANGSLYLQYTAGDPYLLNTLGAYIDTGYCGTSNTKYVIDFMFKKSQTTNKPTVFGTIDSSSGDDPVNGVFIYQATSSGTELTTFGWGGPFDVSYLYDDFSVGERFVYTYNSDELRIHYTSGAGSVISSPGGTVTTTTPIGIFTRLDNGIPEDACYTDGMALYGFKIYENDVLVHDYVPYLDSNNTPCLYDADNDEYLYQSGTGDLEYMVSGEITNVYVKVNDEWKELIGADINDPESSS